MGIAIQMTGTGSILFLFCVFVLTVRTSLGQLNSIVTPPPRDGNRPVISDGIVWYLDHIAQHCRKPLVATYPGGGIIKDRRALMTINNPHIINGNIEIAPSGCLYIEPGCELRFGPGFGILVNGTLISRGSDEPGGRILMTTNVGGDPGGPSGDWQTDARLVDGNTTQDGRLDLLYHGRWRGICTNYRNYTEIDADVTCRHLGFLKGNFTYHSFARNYTDYMLFEGPRCVGYENSLLHCPGVAGIVTGAHVCDGQQLIGFECEGLRPGLAENHWRGLEFYNSTLEELYMDTNVYMNQSSSWMEYTDVLYAGLDTFRGKGVGVNYQRAAISASPYVPLMNNVTIKYSAYDGLNLTEIEGSIHIANSTVSHNRGYGMFIKTTVGRVLVNMTNVTDNWGDGIKMYMTNLTLASHEFPKRFPFGESFCNTNNMNVQVFPVLQAQDVIGIQGQKPLGSSCDRMFTTVNKKKVTVHFLRLIRDPEATGEIEIRDGSPLGTPVAVYPVTNGSFPQSFVSKTETLYIRLKWNIPRRWRCSTFKPCLRVLIELGTTHEIEEDFRLIYSQVSNNIGYGVSVQDMRSKVFFNTSEVSDNQYGAGIRVYQGAGEVTVNNTLIARNQGSGVNITYSGGFQLLNNSRLVANRGYGAITEYLQLNRTRIEAEQRLEVVRCHFELNEWRGLRVGNYCRGGHAQVNESSFLNNLDEAIEYLSCNISTKKSTNFTIAFTTFHSNRRHGVFIRPLINTVGIFSNNSFSNHSMGALLIDNGYDLLVSRWYRQFPVEYNFFENTFRENYGRYALNVRLTQGSPFQKMFVKFNQFIDNSINDSFMYLNPRNRANAVIVISSGNVKLMRNRIENPDSIRQIATHLIDPSVKIDATQNWWGFEVLKGNDQAPIHQSIFDQDDRYNLAQVEYYPVLNTGRLYNDILSDTVPRYNWQFHRGNRIGGILELNNFKTQPNSVYHVDRDIYIIPGRVLTLARGTVLEFDSSVGMVVHGCLNANGNNRADTIKFQLRENPDELPIENRTASVRLVDGRDEFEGRLEVLIDDKWGTICNEGWTHQNSIIACQQLGLIYNPEVSSEQTQLADESAAILLSWVNCEEVDTDITKCRSVRGPETRCTHNKDVFLRCQSPTWAGITFPATPRDGQTCSTVLNHIAIHRAGLLDSDTTHLTPALRIDYNYYAMSHINVTDSLSDGIHVKFNHPYSENRIEYANVINSAGNGIVLRSPRMDLLYSTVTNSGKAGFLHDPYFSEYDSLTVRNSIHSTRQTFLTERPTIVVGDRKMLFLVTKPGMAREDHVYWCELTVSNTFRVTLQLLDYSPATHVEEVVIYDSGRATIQPGVTRHWKIEEDLIDFPVVSVSTKLTIRYHVKGVQSGRLAFAVISETYKPTGPVLKTYLRNCTFDYNNQGIVTKHYNNPSNQRMELFLRHKEETFWFDRVNVYHSRREAMHMPSVTKYHDDYIPTWQEMSVPHKVATIQYTIQQCKFIDNARGILAEHNHVDFANNVWHWYVTQVEIRRTGEGGFEIELPRVNDEEEVRKHHSVVFNQSLVVDNRKFAFTIAGFYADVSIMNNEFVNNVCRLGLMLISGMEKKIQISVNGFKTNVGRYVINLDIISHSEYSEVVSGILYKNSVRNNRKNPADKPPGSEFSPKTYGVAFRGAQKMSAHRNLFHNPDLGYEFVAATTALSLGNTLDVKENWWGKTDIYSIEMRIFDFDDWNNYAVASYHPYLTKADTESDLSDGEKVDRPIDPSRLGGRVFRSLILPYQPEPYIVYADLTVMPNAKLILQPGTELQFRPNVGILVLGQLIARGLFYSRIKLRPLQPSRISRSTRKDEFLHIVKDPMSRSIRSTDNLAGNIRLRGMGTLFKNAGFLELYNVSSKSWNLLCDSQFNEKTAEVVCRELGLETINVRVRFTHLYDHYIHGGPSYFRKEFWMYSYYCSGEETTLDQCQKRYNYNLFPCIYSANYTFVTCGDRNLDRADYWGNIRFATDNYQEEQRKTYDQRVDSVMEFVDIEGAGMLHGEKVGAIQTTYVTPIFRNINITNSASNGYDIIAPRDVLEIHNQNVSGNLGYGINFLVLNGESSNRESSFQPLGLSTIPYFVYGLVEICRMEKEISLNNRMLLYYKYSHKSVDCVKIIRSTLPLKQVGIRFLQLNLFQEDFSRNVIEIFDGRDVKRSNMIKQIFPNSSNSEILQQYSSTGVVLTVHIHASMSHESYGFVAEVVTLPPDDLTYPNSNHFHKLTQAILQGNEDGGIQYKNVGEINPSVYIQQCYIDNNGIAILNLTSPPTVDISLQGTLVFDFSHNYVGRNKGGMYLSVETKTIATAVQGNITNNLFAYGTHGEALNITGHYYERILIYQNYFYNYTAGDFRDIIHVKDVVVNFTYNVVASNVGHYILAAYNSPFGQARQEYVRNGFNDNNSTALYQSTIKVGSGRPLFMHNYILNTLNDFEMEADDNVFNLTSKINASQNWWGSDRYGFINGKIWDFTDNPKYSKVEFERPKLDNRSVVDGKCAPGWKLDTGRCYRYIGGAMPYHEADRFCRDNKAFLADSKNRQEFLYYLLRLMMNNYSPKMRVWVAAGNTKSGWCTAIELNYIVIEQDCKRILHPFICETDPYVAPPSDLKESIVAMAIGIGVGVGGTIVIVVLVIAILWLIKSRRREKERFERTASMRSSLRSLRTKSQETILSGAASRRRLDEMESQTSAKTSSRNGSVITGSVGSMHSTHMLKPLHRSMDSLDASRESIPSQQRFGAIAGSVEQLQRNQHRYNYAPPEMQKKIHSGQNNRAYNENEDEEDDDDDGFASDTFDDDFEDEAKVPKVAYSGRNMGKPGQAPQVKNGILRPVGSPQVAQIYDDVPDENDNDSDDDDDDDDKSDSVRKSLSSFSQPESPTTPIKENIFLPRQSNLPTPPPDPRHPTSDSHYANVPGYQKPMFNRATKPVPAPRSRTSDLHNDSRSSSQFQESPKPNPRDPSNKNNQSRPFHSVENLLEAPPYSQSREELQAASRTFHSVENISPPPYFPSYENLHSQNAAAQPFRLPPLTRQDPPSYTPGPPAASGRPQYPPSYRNSPSEHLLRLNVNPDSVETEI